MTKLQDLLQMSKEDILNGDVAEYEAVDKKTRRDKSQDLYLASVVDKVTEAVFADLADAYRACDRLDKEKQDLQAKLDQSENDRRAAQEQLNKMSNSINRQDQLEEEFKKSQLSLMSIQKQFGTLTSKFGDTSKQLDDAQKARQELEEKLNNLHGDFDGAQAKLTDMTNKLNEANANLTAAQAEKTRIGDAVNEVITALNTRYGEFLEKINRQQAEIEQKQNANESSQKQVEKSSDLDEATLPPEEEPDFDYALDDLPDDDNLPE